MARPKGGVPVNREPVIRFVNFSFQYFSQAEPTLREIDLCIYPGEKVLIVGPSGSGKSTLGHCLNGLIPFAYQGPITGQLEVCGQPTQNLDIFARSKLIGTVLQDADGQFVGLTAGEDIAFALENDEVPTPAMHQRVKEVAAMVEMEDFLGASPYELSGGQKQRTALAGVLVDQVELLLFDEPLASLDPATGKTAVEIIEQIHQQTRKTIIIIEHRLEDVLHRPVDRIILMDEGRIVADLDPHAMVASSLLTDHGIREPLYVTALKYAGIEVTPAMAPAYIQTLRLAGAEAALRAWHEGVPQLEPSSQVESLLALEGVSFSYDGRRPTLTQVDIALAPGEMVAVVGKNGAGKSTLARLLCGFLRHDQGCIRVRGQDIAGLSIKERAEVFGFVLQNPNQMISKALIYDEVALGLRLRGLSEDEVTQRVDEALAVCGLKPYASWPIAALSYGQKKRVTIASILALRPQVLILDEPTAGQDHRHYQEIMEFLRRINATGVTVILITHDMHLMLEYAPRAIVLTRGRVIADTLASVVLTEEAIIEAANLKETSLYRLAELAGIADQTSFVQSFINYERQGGQGDEG